MRSDGNSMEQIMKVIVSVEMHFILISYNEEEAAKNLKLNLAQVLYTQIVTSIGDFGEAVPNVVSRTTALHG